MTVIDDVKEYYGETLQSTDDLKTSACCPIDTMPEFIKPLLKNVHEEVLSRFYGCGSPIPHALDGCTVLDLGCGTGRDCFVLSQLVGDNGKVIGVDMTDNQLDIARKYLSHHKEVTGLDNIVFENSMIEKLDFIEDNSIDAVVSNCVINLSTDKKAVFEEIHRILKPGGELYFSDIFSHQRVPAHIASDPIVLGECLGGALYTHDFRRILQQVGFNDWRVVSSAPLSIHDTEVYEKAGGIDFYSATVRTFKCEFEDICEDYGQVAYYKGGIENSPHSFLLDDHHLFKKGKPEPVCGNSAAMLMQTRYGKYFNITGDTNTHYGEFDCSPKNATTSDSCC